MKKMNKKGIAPLLIVLIGLIVVGALVYSGFNFKNLSTASLTGSGNYIERPVFKYVKCEAVGSLTNSVYAQLDYAGNGGWALKPSVTDQYTINVQAKHPLSLCPVNVIYSVCTSQVESKENCLNKYQVKVPVDSTVWDDYKFVVAITGVKPLEYVHLQINGCNKLSDSNIKYQVSFMPYGLREYDVLSGSANPINPNDCTDNRAGQSSWNDRLLGSDSSKVNSIKNTISVNEKKLQPNEVRWYVSGYLTSAAPSFALTYQGKSAWCRQTGTSAEIYKINTLTLGSGTYRIASADYSDFLGSVKCCPGEVSGNQVCQSDFTYKPIIDSTCGGFQACGSPNWVPFAEKTLIKYSCDSSTGKCVSQTKKVECANDYDCRTSNNLCDLNTYKCVNPNVNLNGQKITIAPDNSADCKEQGGTWKTTSETKKTGTFCIFGVGLCEQNTITTAYCDTSGTNWLLYIVIAAVIIILIIFGKPIIMSIRGIFRI